MAEQWLLLFAHVVLAPATALHALLYKRDPRAAFGWIAVCILLPLGGPVLYLLFGINRVRSHAARRVPRGFSPGFERGDAVVQPHPLPEDLSPLFLPLARVGAGLSRHRLLTGNRVEALYNGEGAYPPMLAAIRGATRRVYLSSYIFDTDRTGRAFVDALADANARGVDVRVLVDGMGEWYSWPRVRRLLVRRRVRVARFMPLTLLPPSIHINMRKHHKLLVVDTTVAFTGGMNLGDRHLVEGEHRETGVADVQFQVEGPAVAQLEDVFLQLWSFTTGAPRTATGPAPEPCGEMRCRVITDGPDEDLDRLTMLLVAAISLAREELRIMTPYFLPPREIIAALQGAAIRGVAVTLVLPATNNLPYMHWATRNMLWELLSRGVRVVYQPPPFVHSKLLVVDRHYALVGSANWDARSLRLNFELMLEIYDTALAGELSAHIDAAAANGEAVTLAQVDGRSLPVRLRDSVCWLFTPYL